MMNIPTRRTPGVRSVVLRLVSRASRVLRIIAGVPAPRPVPAKVKPLPGPASRRRA